MTNHLSLFLKSQRIARSPKLTHLTIFQHLWSWVLRRGVLATWHSNFPRRSNVSPDFYSALNFFPDAQMFPQIFIRRSNFFLALKCFPRFLFGAQFFSRRSNVFPNFLLHDHPSSCNQRRKASAHSSNTSGLSNIRQQCKLDSCAHVVINVEDDGVALNRSQILLKMYRRRQRRQERHPLGELARQSGLSSSSRSANARGKRRFERLENFFVCPPCIRR